MLRKMFVFAILAIAAIGFAGCNSSSDDGVPPLNISGIYEVQFFGSSQENASDPAMALLMTGPYITNDCAKAISLKLANDPEKPGINMCAPTPVNQATLLGGEIAINGTLAGGYIFSKMQLAGGIVEMSPSDKYQYTIYNPYNIMLKGVGVNGYNFDAATGKPSLAWIDNPLSTFEIKLDGDILTIKLLLKNKSINLNPADPTAAFTVDARTTVIAKKKAGAPFVKPENTLFVPFPVAP